MPLKPTLLLVAVAALAPSCRTSATARAASESAVRPSDGAFLAPTVDAERGTVTLDLPPPDAGGVHLECLHIVGLETGLGANDVGLDRGEMGRPRLVRFQRAGSKVALMEVNLRFRAEEGSPEERGAVGESFAPSVLFAAEPVRRRPDGSVTLDITGLLTRDAYGLGRSLAAADQGSFAVDAGRSAVLTGRARTYPRNCDFAALLTLTSSSPGRLARATAPDGGALTFVQRQAFVALPDGDYERRPFTPRMGAFSIGYTDMSVPLDAPTARRFAIRHRLSKDEPLVYHVDRAAPEPVRSALVEGASWWAEAFEAAGFPGVFQVKVAPEGLDLLDVRNNVIQWVHRSTRGWSYGNALTDPRTGEILKGHVSLGSLRVRQDRLLFEGLLGVEGTGSGAADDPVELSLARIRQLAAHEVGHTLGLSHNFAASALGRASVMDYPAPRVRPGADGGIDVSDAYGVGVGAWDVHAIRMLYQEPGPEEDVREVMARVQAEGDAAGLLFLTDQDARPASAAHPLANLWDDGPDPVEALERALEVRARALSTFGEGNLAEGRPLAELEEVFVPLYLYHRYQVEAAVKAVGGVTYRHLPNGPGVRGMAPVDAAAQRRALETLGRTLLPETLEVPGRIAALLSPRPPGYGASRETFRRRQGPAFDDLGAAEVAARLTLRPLMEPSRLARISAQSAERSGGPAAFESLDDYVDAVAELAGLRGDLERGYLHDVVRVVALQEMLRSYLAPRTANGARDAMRRGLALGGDAASRAGLVELHERIKAVLERGHAPADGDLLDGAPEAPPGSPIGCGCDS